MLNKIATMEEQNARRQWNKMNAVERLKSTNAAMMSALQACEEYFEPRADAEYFTISAGAEGNDEMNLLMTVQSAIAKARGKS